MKLQSLTMGSTLANANRRGLRAAALAVLAASAFPALAATDPLIGSWQTALSGRYARVVQTNGGSPTTTWPAAGLTNMGGGQATPAYADVQQVSYSANWVYVKVTGLASHQMGPWYNATGTIFGNWSKNVKRLRRFTRNPTPATTKVTNGLGALGLWVNGVALFNLLDGFSYNTTQAREVNGTTNTWIRNAVPTEGPTFDKSNAHQPGNGEYHYHSNPVGLRYQLNDNVSYDAATGFSEATSGFHHSPILGWADDGYPIYGPYGYSNPLDANSSVKRIKSGFVIRDGANGTTNLVTAGRQTLGKWAATLKGTSQTLATTQYGPAVSTTYPLGRYVEDFDFLGDLGQTQGVGFDLDIYNGRFCRTPEYPNGTYAYFVTLDSAGAPAFPYVMGRQYYGTVQGGNVASITETVTTYKAAGPSTPIVAEVLRIGGGVKVKWTSIEGGTYLLQGSNDGLVWTNLASNIASGGLATSVSFASGNAAAGYGQYRVTLTATSTYDNF